MKNPEPVHAAVSMDPITFEVVRNALVEATEEMSIALKRSAYSTNIKTRADYSCAFFDRDLHPVAQAFTQPVHLGSLSQIVPQVISAYGPENIFPEDGILANDPYLGGVHLNDITLISPVHYQGRLFGYVASLAHHVDVGGGAPASIGAFREVFQEGIIIPGIKLVAEGKINDDLFRLVLAQIRSKRETAGDFRAQIAANTTGARRIQALLDRMGRETIESTIDELMAYTERRARADIAKLPQGTFAAEGIIDNDGFTDIPVRLRVQVVIDDDGILFDLSGSDPQRRAPVNATFAQTYSACAYVLKALISPDVPVNQGLYRLVRIHAPLGTVVNARAPAPVVGGWETNARLTDVIFKALSPALPARIPAGTKGMMCQVGFGGHDPRTDELFAYYETLAGGYGGRAASDGPDAVQCHGQNTENAPIEETEIHYPVRIARYELIDDSEGPGRQRGGLGLRRDYLFGQDVSFTVLADRDREGPWGLFGGSGAGPARYVLNPGEQGTNIGSKSTIELSPGDVISVQSCGGGGFGPAEQRDPEAVLVDVRDGKVSVERAREIYRVVIDAERWTIDVASTERLRAESSAGQ